MKPGSKSWKMFMNKIRAYSRIIYALTIGAIALDMEISFTMVILSGITIAFTNFLIAFEPVHSDPRWELVYPELALGEMEEI
jgi:hypothetical protein